MLIIILIIVTVKEAEYNSLVEALENKTTVLKKLVGNWYDFAEKAKLAKYEMEKMMAEINIADFGM